MTKEKKAETPKVTAEAVRALQRRVNAFAATGITSHAPTTYHR
ncbi:hypothetical protein QIS99_28130 [Streptomyces sp. B-S-A8]|uniref:Uncharacterized protein n=1 Tax=Streptomyces solicavernae TaxID=3043614 RepID=A0ABT6S008_9ACTN|nr:hypothetical protein [Streptomyces sp. B-S-A8]MDI3390031.1 hypothetical protein [Streptomyces sp. B-S-A8]